MRRSARGMIGVVAALGAAFAIGVPTVSANVLWTMTASPATGSVGVGTVFTFTATNLDPLLGIKCVTVEMPNALPVGETWIAGSNTTAAWATSRSEQLVTAVIDTGDGDEKLRVGDWLSFSVAVVPSAPGVYAPSAVAYSGHECVNGARGLAAPPAFVISGDVVPEPLLPPATPIPTPLPAIDLPPVLPEPSATPLSAVIPTPRGTQPPAAQAQPGLVAQPEVLAAQAEAAPAAPEPPTGPERDAPRTSSGVTTAAAPPAPAAPAPPNRPVLAVATPDDDSAAADVSLGPLGAIEGFGVWGVPGAVVGGPGILVMLWVALQTGVAAAWIPAVRRMRGAEHRRPGPGRRAGDLLWPGART